MCRHGANRMNNPHFPPVERMSPRQAVGSVRKHRHARCEVAPSIEGNHRGEAHRHASASVDERKAFPFRRWLQRGRLRRVDGNPAHGCSLFTESATWELPLLMATNDSPSGGGERRQSTFMMGLIGSTSFRKFQQNGVPSAPSAQAWGNPTAISAVGGAESHAASAIRRNVRTRSAGGRKSGVSGVG